MAIQVLKQSVGIDMSKDSLLVCFCRQESDRPFVVRWSKQFTSDRRGLSQLNQRLQREASACGAPLYILLEPTGVYHEEVAYMLHEHGFWVSMVLPNRSKHFAKSLDHKGKSDESDAQMLARMALERQMPKWVPPSATMLEIRRLCRERQALLDDKTAVGNRLHASEWSHKPDGEMLKRALKHLKFIAGQVKEVEQQIKKRIDGDPDLKCRIEAVCSIKGVGSITAATVVGETNGFALFKNKAQLVSYAGYDVVKEQSGTSLDTPGKISKKGSSYLRKALHFPAITAVKHDPLFNKMFNRVMDKTKVKMKGYVAVQRKLLVLIYTIYKSGQKFDPNYVSIKKPNLTQTKQAGTSAPA